MKLTDRIRALHERFVLLHPVATLAVVAAITAVFAWHAQDFSLDASADSLTLERDQDLNYYRMVRARYGSDDYLIVTFSPKEELFTDSVLQRLSELRSDLIRSLGSKRSARRRQRQAFLG